MKAICVSGTPGTGKTVISKALSKKLGYIYLDVKKEIKDNKLNQEYDSKRKTYVIDLKKLNKLLIQKIKNSKKRLVIDSHLSHELPRKYIKLCIIAKCDLKELNRRLKKRGYASAKIRENLDSEIFDICLNEAKDKKHKILVVDTTKRLEIKKLMDKIR